MSNVNMWEIENSVYCDDIQVICGVDEAGRGPLAGPVCAAAVILPKGLELPGLTDSKKTRGKSIRVSFTENNEISIDCSILVSYGRSVMDVSASAQEVISNAVESTAGVNVSAVNVFVCGIVHQ